MFVLNHIAVFMNYFDNPGGMIPTWLVNWAAKVSAASTWCNQRSGECVDGCVLLSDGRPWLSHRHEEGLQ